MFRTVTARTLNVFAGTKGAGMAFNEVTVLLVRMGSAQVRTWNWLEDEDGRHPMSGYEVRDMTGALLGVILTVGWLDGFIHAEWYDPATDEFYAAGECAQVTTQGIARVLEARGREVAPVPAGRDEVLDPEPLPVRRNVACPFLYCFDSHCIDHAPVWAKAA